MKQHAKYRKTYKFCLLILDMMDTNKSIFHCKELLPNNSRQGAEVHTSYLKFKVHKYYVLI